MDSREKARREHDEIYQPFIGKDMNVVAKMKVDKWLKDVDGLPDPEHLALLKEQHR